MSKPIKATLRLPSPNNTKVQVALAYKSLDYEIDPVIGMEPETLAKLVDLSGQPMTPILEHGETVVFDSAAILRYLDANFPGPRLFSADREEMKAIEGWESFHREDILNAIGPAFGVVFGGLEGAEAEAAIAEANTNIHAVTEKVESHLEAQAAQGSDWLVGDSMTAADISVGCYLCLTAMPEGFADRNPLWKWFAANIDLGAGRDRCRAHINRVMAYLPAPVTS